MTKLRVLSLNLLLSILAIAITSSAFLLDRFLPVQLPQALTLMAWPPLLLGGVLIIWAVATLMRESGASGAPFDPTAQLVSSGPYAWLRNPIYAGDIVLLLGLSFLLQSPGLLVYTILFALAIDVFVRRVEEPRTEARLGEVYRGYMEKVPRWIPSIRLYGGEDA